MRSRKDIRRLFALSLPVLLTGIVGCEANGPRIAVVHPTGAGDLAQIAAECRHPKSAEYAACMKAAEILEENPRDATDAYLRNWNHVGWSDRHVVRPIDPTAALIPFEVAPPCGDRNIAKADAVIGGAILVASIGQAAYDAAHEERVFAAASITTRALRYVYRRSGDPYSRAMLDELPEVDFHSGDSFDRFAAASDYYADAAERGELALPYPQQPSRDEMAATTTPEVPDDEPLPPPSYVPRGKGPVPFLTRSGWVVVEAGQAVGIGTQAGARWKGTIAALSTKGILLQTRRGDAFIAADDVWVIDR